MILRKPLSHIGYLCVALAALAAPLSANMRAPVHIQHGSSELRGMPADLRVLNEVLEFHCPESYKGKPDMNALAARTCNVRVVYRISASAATQVKLAFVYAGKGDVQWKVAGKVFRSSPSVLKDTDKKVCSYCPDEMKRLYKAEQTVDLASGSNEIEVSYEQALSYDESGHSYFSDGRWAQGFTYELWPIAEWQWAPDFHAELKFSIAARSGFLGIGYKDDQMRCSIEENGKYTEIPISVQKVTGDRRTATARIELKRRPQRLDCSYSAE